MVCAVAGSVQSRAWMSWCREMERDGGMEKGTGVWRDGIAGGKGQRIEWSKGKRAADKKKNVDTNQISPKPIVHDVISNPHQRRASTPTMLASLAPAHALECPEDTAHRQRRSGVSLKPSSGRSSRLHVCMDGWLHKATHLRQEAGSYPSRMRPLGYGLPTALREE